MPINGKKPKKVSNMNQSSKQNALDLQQAFTSSPFGDMKLFVEPNTQVSAQACAVEVLKVLPQFLALQAGEREAKYNF
jgi:hypothetical protein